MELLGWHLTYILHTYILTCVSVMYDSLKYGFHSTCSVHYLIPTGTKGGAYVFGLHWRVRSSKFQHLQRSWRPIPAVEHGTETYLSFRSLRRGTGKPCRLAWECTMTLVSSITCIFRWTFSANARKVRPLRTYPKVSDRTSRKSSEHHTLVPAVITRP